MNRTKMLVVAVLAVAGLSGCVTLDAPRSDAAQAAKQVSRPLPSYGSLGGYRYRRFAAVNPQSS